MIRQTTTFSLILAATACAGSSEQPPEGSASSTTASGTTSGEAPEATSAVAESGSTGSSGTDPGVSTLPPPPADSSSTGEIQSAPEVIDFEFCELEAGPNAAVVGTTPDGTFDGRYAWFGWLMCEGEGISPTIVIAESPDDLAEAVLQNPDFNATPDRSIEWYLFGACGPGDEWVGSGHVTAFLRDNGEMQEGGGFIQITETHRMFDELDPDDPPRMTGIIRVDSDGFDVEGEFTAAYCGPLAYEIGCDE